MRTRSQTSKATVSRAESSVLLLSASDGFCVTALQPERVEQC